MTTIGLYSGSFDPLYWGHAEVLRQASRLFDTVIVVVADNANKNTCNDQPLVF